MFEKITFMLAQADAPPSSPSTGDGGAGLSPPQTGTPVNPGAGPGGLGNPDAAGGSGAPADPGMSQMLFILIIFLGVMFIYSMMSQRKEKKKRATLLASLKKGSKVQTVGGMLGTVVEVRDQDVIVKVDENSNTRIKFLRSAIQSVVQDKEED